MHTVRMFSAREGIVTDFMPEKSLVGVPYGSSTRKFTMSIFVKDGPHFMSELSRNSRLTELTVFFSVTLEPPCQATSTGIVSSSAA